MWSVMPIGGHMWSKMERNGAMWCNMHLGGAAKACEVGPGDASAKFAGLLVKVLDIWGGLPYTLDKLQKVAARRSKGGVTACIGLTEQNMRLGWIGSAEPGLVCSSIGGFTASPDGASGFAAMSRCRKRTTCPFSADLLPGILIRRSGPGKPRRQECGMW